MPEPWGPIPGERGRAGLAFSYYRNMPGRSLATLARLLRRKPSYVRQLKRWSARYWWHARVLAWDCHNGNVILSSGGRDLPPRVAWLVYWYRIPPRSWPRWGYRLPAAYWEEFALMYGPPWELYPLAPSGWAPGRH